MHRHRVLAHTQGNPSGYTVALVRFLTDDQARQVLARAKSPYKETDALTLVREEFTVQGVVTSRLDVTDPTWVFDYETRTRPLNEDPAPRRGRATVQAPDYETALNAAARLAMSHPGAEMVVALDLVL